MAPPGPIAAAPAPIAIARAARPKLPLVKRHSHEWWFEEHEPRPRDAGTDSEVREVLASLSVPLHVAVIGYAGGCRIRRVRLHSV